MKYGPLCSVEPDINNQATNAPIDGNEEDGTLQHRLDGRKSDGELRAMFFRGSVLSHAVGSSFVEVGGTKIFAAVYGPRSSNSVEAMLHCELRWAQFSTASAVRERRATDEERELSRALGRALRPSLLLDKYPKSRIDLCVFVLEDDGAAFATAVTAGSFALADAGIHLSGFVVGASAGILSNDDEDGEQMSDGNNQILLDPCGKEEQLLDITLVTATVHFQFNAGGITTLIVTGEADVDAVQQAVQLCTGSAGQICGLLKSTLVKQARKALKRK